MVKGYVENYVQYNRPLSLSQSHVFVITRQSKGKKQLIIESPWLHAPSILSVALGVLCRRLICVRFLGISTSNLKHQNPKKVRVHVMRREDGETLDLESYSYSILDGGR